MLLPLEWDIVLELGLHLARSLSFPRIWGCRPPTRPRTTALDPGRRISLDRSFCCFSTNLRICFPQLQETKVCSVAQVFFHNRSLFIILLAFWRSLCDISESTYLCATTPVFGPLALISAMENTLNFLYVTYVIWACPVRSSHRRTILPRR